MPKRYLVVRTQKPFILAELEQGQLRQGWGSNPPKGQMRTLQLMRGLANEFTALDLRPKWVRPDAHPAVHFDQFLHAYYYDYVRAGSGPEEDEELSGLQKVEAGFVRNRANPAAALEEAAKWWVSLPSDLFGEEAFIHEKAPAMQQQLPGD